jgi:post-segregation antitoxin (ccd killing protein)
MQINYDLHSPRRHVNLTANSDLIDLVRKEKGNLSALLEQSMITFLAERELMRWKEENRASFESYNRMIEERGTIYDDIGQML